MHYSRFLLNAQEKTQDTFYKLVRSIGFIDSNFSFQDY